MLCVIGESLLVVYSRGSEELVGGGSEAGWLCD